MRRFIQGGVLTVCLFLLISVSVNAFDFGELEKQISERTLDNGLKIIVMENHDAPVASFVTWANVGSVDDPKGYTGIAHMFEHMAFKGTTTLGTTDIDKELELIAIEDSLFMALRSERTKGAQTDTALLATLEEQYEAAREASFELVVPNAFGQLIDREGGVGLNAGTGDDMTIYFYSLPSNKVELWMALESERFLNPVLREMYKERDVVAEERRMRTESSPFGKLIEEFKALAFKSHPYRNPGIGHMSDIQYYSRDEAKAFFDKYYSPSNLVICITGDVKPKKIFKMAEEYWGRIAYRPAPDRIATVEPKQLGERRMVIDDKSQPIFLCGWHIPDQNHSDLPAISAMLDYLGQGRTSILNKRLVKEKKIAVQVMATAGFFGGKYPSTAIALAVPSQGHTNEECEVEILAGIKQLQSEMLTSEEVDQIKARTLSSFIRGLGSNVGMAMQLAGYQTFTGDWRNMFKELDKINAVTPEDIKRVANLYFNNTNRTVVMLENTESSEEGN